MGLGLGVLGWLGIFGARPDSFRSLQNEGMERKMESTIEGLGVPLITKKIKIPQFF